MACKPTVDEHGNTHYLAEDGDNAETLVSQYGISQEQAEKITGTEGDETISEGTPISGSEVKKVTGSDVMRLDLDSEMATDQRIVDQTVFAMDHSNGIGFDAFYSTQYVSNTKFKNVIKASGTI